MDLHEDVKQYLTGLRARLTPEQAGVPVFGGERRVPGLRREEVAQLAGVSTAYYTRIERGDLRGVSGSVLHALARALAMNDAETQHLFDLARAFDGGPPRRPRPRPLLPARISHLLATMGDVPAIVLGRLGDPLGSNALGRALFPHLFPDGEAPLNHTRYLFLDGRAQDFYADWERSGHHVVSTLRLVAGRDPGDRALTALVGELATRSPEFRTWWAGHTVRVHSAGTKALHHPVVGDVTVEYESMALGSVADARLVTYLAEPGTPSADALDLLRTWVTTTADVSPTSG
ncbi:helix-turn-helix domain-containing protein [Promicromonospora sp. NFX87]|uniref:helix-turn-helix domain-containing protein n=1 Tax=Promicromonospora sp. NFX87 TaxID=3402691 RepID=UPI003AFA27CA